MKITHNPIKELVIHQLVKTELDEFKKKLLTNGWHQARWVGGILLVHTAPPAIDRYEDYEVQGKIFWPYCEFAKCENIPENNVIKTKDTGAAELIVVDVSNNEIFVDFAKWLKAQSIWNNGENNPKGLPSTGTVIKEQY